MNHLAFGTTLKQWRGHRRMSQMALGALANVSARHVSFLETGRANPSRTMVNLLARALDLPRSARNLLLNASGFSGSYEQRGLDEKDMGHVLKAISWTLSRHDPYPGFAFDRHWKVVKANNAATTMLGAMGVKPDNSLLEILCDIDALKRIVKNWQEVAPYIIARLRTESAHHGGEEILDHHANRLAANFDDEFDIGVGALPAVIPAIYIAGGLELSFISTIAQFGTAEDIALADMMIELMFPADENTRLLLENMAQQ